MTRTVACVLALATSVGGASVRAGAAEEAHAHWAVATADPKAQGAFDRGLAMLYAFDVGEARVAFAGAAERDPDLAMAYWGMAEADTIDINRPSTPEGEQRGAAAVAKARAHESHASLEERALIGAIAQRFAKGSEKKKFARYAGALSAFAKTHRDEPNALAVTAFAIYDAEDVLLDAKDAPTPKAREMLDDLDRALVLEPTNLGAHHLRIHLLESTNRAKDAIPDADALSSYAYPPGESHLPHMAGHIWARTGDYERLVSDNQTAVANDRAWFALGDGPGQQYMRTYHDHDLDFVLYGLTTLGRDAEARTAAQDESASTRAKLAVRLHDDAAVLAEPKASEFLRGVAAGRSGDAAKARAAIAKLGSGEPVRRRLVEAALATGAKDHDGAVAAYAAAYAATKTSFPGDPKDYWATPVGEGYGAALLAAGKPAQAETVFTAELVRFPNDPHLEWGLAQAQAAQHRDDAAARAAYHAHWKGSSDLTLDRLG
jgi:predicted Zn-dependent protease